MGSRRRRGTGKGVANLQRSVAPARVTPKIPAAPRDWDSDAPDENAPYSQAVETVLEALEGLWYDSEYFHPDAGDKARWEREVNDHVQAIKRKIQEML